MATLKSDEHGFLTGTPISIGTSEFARSIALWQDIRNDTAAIRQAISRQAAIVKTHQTGQQASNSAVFKAKRSGPAVLPQRNDRGQFVKAASPSSSNKREMQAMANIAVAAVNAATPSRKKRDVSAQLRGPGGRFLTSSEKEAIANGSLSPSDLGSSGVSRGKFGKDDDGRAKSYYNNTKDVTKGVVGVAGHLTEGLDPTVAASREVIGLVAPVFGLGEKLVGLEKGNVPWYRRIWGELRDINKREESRGGRGGAGILTMLASFAASLLGLPGKLAGAVLGLIPKLFGFGGKGGGIGGGGGRFDGWKSMSKMGRMGKVLKFGGPLAALLAGGEIYQTENDESLTREQKTKKNFGSVGGAVGGVVGGALGTLLDPLIGPLGTMGGAALGNWVGEAVGKKLADVDWKGIGDQIVKAWTDVTDLISKGWDALKNAAAPYVDKAKDIAENVIGKAKDVVNTVTAASSPTIKVAKDTFEVATDAAKKAADVVSKASKETYQDAKEVVSKAYQSTKDWVLGQTSKKFESGGRGAGTISTGKGDHGGMSYGTYQLSSKMGTVQDFLKSSKYGKEFEGLTPGSADFNAKWKQIAAQDPEFGAAQHDFIKSSHFDPQMAKLKKAGIDLSDRGAAVQDAIWSTSVQFGGRSSVIQQALSGKNIANMSDSDIVAAIQDYKTANNEKLFKKSSSDVRESTRARATNEKNDLVSLAGAYGSALPNLASAASPQPPQIPSSNTTPVAAGITIAQPPSVASPLASSGGDGRSVTVVPAPAEAGQNMHDRAIAQIATGGMGNYMGGRA